MSLKRKRSQPLWNGVCEKCRWMTTSNEGLNALFRREYNHTERGVIRPLAELIAGSKLGCSCCILIYNSTSRASFGRGKKADLRSGDNTASLEIKAYFVQSGDPRKTRAYPTDYWHSDTTTTQIELFVTNPEYRSWSMDIGSHLPEQGIKLLGPLEKYWR